MTAQNIEQNTQEWRELRRKYMGSSDAPAALGMSRYRSPVEVAQEKRLPKTADAFPSPETEAQRRGHVLEEVVARRFARHMGMSESRLLPGGHVVHPEHDFMAASPDRRLDGENTLLECKTHNLWLRDQYGEDGSDNVTDCEYIQVQHQMAVTGAEAVYVAVLFAAEETFGILVKMLDGGANIESVCDLAENLDLAVFIVNRDDALIADLIAAEKDFWQRYVIGDEIPADIKTCTPRDNIRAATESEDRLAHNLKLAWLENNRWSTSFDLLKAEMQDAIAEDNGISTKEGNITWKKSKDATSEVTDWEAIAEGLGKTVSPETYAELVKQATKTVVKPGVRRFLVPAAWKKDL